MSLKKITKESLFQQLEEVTKERDNLKRANMVLNELVGTQYAEIEVRKSELRIIKNEIKSWKQ